MCLGDGLPSARAPGSGIEMASVDRPASECGNRNSEYRPRFFVEWTHRRCSYLEVTLKGCAGQGGAAGAASPGCSVGGGAHSPGQATEGPVGKMQLN